MCLLVAVWNDKLVHADRYRWWWANGVWNQPSQDDGFQEREPEQQTSSLFDPWEHTPYSNHPGHRIPSALCGAAGGGWRLFECPWFVTRCLVHDDFGMETIFASLWFAWSLKQYQAISNSIYWSDAQQCSRFVMMMIEHTWNLWDCGHLYVNIYIDLENNAIYIYMMGLSHQPGLLFCKRLWQASEVQKKDEVSTWDLLNVAGRDLQS